MTLPPFLSSVHNPTVKELAHAARHGHLSGQGACFAEGPHLVAEASRSHCRLLALLAVHERAAEAQRLAPGAPLTTVSPAVLEKIATTEQPQGMLALVEWPAFPLDQLLADPRPLILLDGLQDPGNVGAIARLAEAFNAAGLLLLPGCARPHHPKTLRASAGSLFRVPAVDVPLDLALPRRRLVATTDAAAPVAQTIDWREPFALIIGNEGHGVREQVARGALGVRIPTRTVESLNAATAAGILLYEASRT